MEIARATASSTATSSKARGLAQDYALDLLALSFLLALSLLLLSRQILLGGTIYNDDIVLQSIPVYSWFSERLAGGQIPLWSPAILGGFPLAFAQYGFFYPPDILLFRILDPARAFHLSLALHLALAGICCYWYCRVLGLRRVPSLLAAVAFQMGNEVTSWPANGYITKTMFILPALLATIELMLRKSLRCWLLIPWIVGGALLVGYAQIVLFALVVAAAYALVAVLMCLRPKPALAFKFLFLLGMGVAWGFGLATTRVAPTLVVTNLSTRSEGMAYEHLMADSIEPWAFILGYLLPAVFELPGRDVARPDFFGVPVLCLSLLWLTVCRQSGRIGWFHLGLALVTSVLSLGKFTPAYGMLVQLPFFSYFHGPNRLSLVAALAISVLAAFVLDRKIVADLCAHKFAHRLMLVAGGVAATVSIVLILLSISLHFGKASPLSVLEIADSQYWGSLSIFRLRSGLQVLILAATPILFLACAKGCIKHRQFEWSMLLLSALVLFSLGWFRYSWMPPDVFHATPKLNEALSKDSGKYRVFSWAPRLSTYNVRVYYDSVVGSAPSIDFNERYLRQYLPPNLNMLFGVTTPDGYEALTSRRQALTAIYMGSERLDTARFRDGSDVNSAIYGRNLSDRLNFLAVLNVGYVMHPFPVSDPRLELVDDTAVRIYPHLDAMAKVHLYRLKTAMPRAFVVPESVVMKDERQVLDALIAGSVDLRERVILEEDPRQLEGPKLTDEGTYLEIVEYLDERVVVDAHTDGSGYLVLMDFLLPGWTATVDGLPEQILAGNFAGRAVPLKGPGEHRIEFCYEAPLYRESALVSLLSQGLLLVAPFFLWLRRVHL